MLERVVGRQLQFVVRLSDGDGPVASGHIILRVVGRPRRRHAAYWRGL